MGGYAEEVRFCYGGASPAGGVLGRQLGREAGGVQSLLEGERDIF